MLGSYARHNRVSAGSGKGWDAAGSSSARAPQNDAAVTGCRLSGHASKGMVWLMDANVSKGGPKPVTTAARSGQPIDRSSVFSQSWAEWVGTVATCRTMLAHG